MKIKKSNLLFRVLIMLCVILSICCCAAPLKAYADEKSYRTDSADFDISFSESGDATIKEIWTVTYTSGSFTRYYKDLFVPGNQLEYFSDIRVIDCQINGKAATATNSMDRIDYHYFFEKSEAQKYTIHWFKAASNETVRYDITYQIPNAVRLDESNNAQYCYRLIGANYPKTVGQVSAKVHLPNENTLNSVTLSSGSYEQDGDVLVCKASSVNGIYKVRLNMKSEDFSDLQRIASVQVPDGFRESENSLNQNNTNNNTSSVGVFWGLIIVLISLFPIIIILLLVKISDIISSNEAKKLIAKDPNCFVEAAMRIQNSNMPFTWYGLKSTGIETNAKYTFFAEIFDLCNKGYLKVTYDGIYINPISLNNEKDNIQLTMDQRFIELLRQHFPIRKEMYGEMIPFLALKDANTSDRAVYQNFNTWKSDYEKFITDSPLYCRLLDIGVIEALKPDFLIWKKYAKYLKLTIDIQSCFSLLERGERINTYTVLQMMQEYLTRRSNMGTNVDNSYYFATYFDNSYNSGSSHSGSGGGCSSCSSCSSCSGCGGGGAD